MKGIIKDPWRVEAPLKPEPKPAKVEGKKIDLSEIDWDKDLKLPEGCLFRSKHGSVAVNSVRVDSANDALRDIARCLFELQEVGHVDASIGFHVDEFSHNVPASPEQGSSIRTSDGYQPAAAVWFVDAPYDLGMLRLVKLLAGAKRPYGEILKKWGVIPMIVR